MSRKERVLKKRYAIFCEGDTEYNYIDKMNTSIGDEAALVFASQFYSSIGFGKNIKTAFDQARAALMLEGIPEETTPELYVRDSLKAEDIVLVKP